MKLGEVVSTIIKTKIYMNYFLEQFILHVNNLLNIAVKFFLDSDKGRG